MEDFNNQDRVFETAAQLFALLATPMRLKIISALCEQEKNVSELLAEIDTTQPSVSIEHYVYIRSTRGVNLKAQQGSTFVCRSPQQLIDSCTHDLLLYTVNS
jgi:ArsR family transcriptional regulator